VDVIGPMAVRIYVEVSGGDDAVLFAGIRKFRGRRELTFEGSFWLRLGYGDQRLAAGSASRAGSPALDA
jgi:uncharacterized protein